MRRSSTPSSALHSPSDFACAGIDYLTYSSSYEKRKHSLRHGTQHQEHNQGKAGVVREIAEKERNFANKLPTKVRSDYVPNLGKMA